MAPPQPRPWPRPRPLQAVDGRILEKPKDREDALGMLRRWAGPGGGAWREVML